MAYHLLSPDVAGELGDGTVLDTSTHPPVVHQLEYVISAWFGSDLLESFPCFVVSAELGKALQESGFGSFELADMQLTVTPEAEELRQGMDVRELPEFVWLKIFGQAGVDDIGVDRRASLVVSDRALELLRRFDLDGCDIEDYQGT
ncbi:hypothetical protein [Prauserella alba]|uniref:Uncharacterized protein n=1 Tax=Prauserella alba TaxID=176898 RepID=A0ABN1VJG2_9PSEU|nr:hypothetical protein [Prauserella alba]MCP2182114.1 hypothetical protein [Prauserella alba]